jgi:hypothetical protein
MILDQENKQKYEDAEMLNYQRKDSPDLFFLNSRNTSRKAKGDTGEFRKQFEKNFNQENVVDDLNVRESDFKITLQLQNQNELNKTTLNQINSFIHSKDVLNPTSEQMNLIYLKLTNYLCELNKMTTHTNSINSNKSDMTIALELQTELLSLMVKITHQKINQV